MEIVKYKNQFVVALHLLFWIVSINAWNIVFNPSVESEGPVKGIQDFWQYYALINFGIYLYMLLPLVWLLKKAKKWLKISFTLLFIVPILYALFELYRSNPDNETVESLTEYFFSTYLYVLVFHLSIAAAVYYNLKILIPGYLSQSRFVLYILQVTGLILVASALNLCLFDYLIDPLFPQLYFISYYKIWELILIHSAYLLLTTILFLIWQYAHMLIVNREKAQNELSALKAQINPHFLFNNLNTIYSMASENDVRTKDVILQLSDFLRYVLYDTSSDTIPLEKEAELITAYVDLQKARINPEITSVSVEVEGNLSNQSIAPLLLLPLAENCFKHGVGKDPGKISLYLGFDGKKLHFRTENPIAKREMNRPDEGGGIGISNVEKRLNLLYPDRHQLLLEESDGIYKVELILTL